MSEEAKHLMAARAAAGGRPFIDWASHLADNPAINAQTMTGRNQQRINSGSINTPEDSINHYKDPMWQADHEDDYDNIRNENAGHAGVNQATGVHAGDAYKQPYHPTFSNETLLHQPGMEGGKWESHGNGLTGFRPSRQNLSNMPGNQLPSYFANREGQGTIVHMPDGRNFAGSRPDGNGIAPKTERNPFGQTSPYRLHPDWADPQNPRGADQEKFDLSQGESFGRATPKQKLDNAWNAPAMLETSQRNATSRMSNWGPVQKGDAPKTFGLTSMNHNLYGTD